MIVIQSSEASPHISIQQESEEDVLEDRETQDTRM